ncbi:tetratricopeptide repeat protein [Streptacidiphilus sp. N1-3]|uniref:Tetratricopeptide repeat protein n=1 Tax=Streptacidiphilus alkalitolerans TaxID=3342712 RepID=A0ABV6X6V3_9ACTN
MSGSAMNAVQAGNIEGGIHFYAPEASRALLHHLPPKPTKFTGREADLDRLNALLAADSQAGRSTVIVSAVAGTAGVGKTALALHWSHSILDRFPDGNLYVNLQGYGPGAIVSAHQALEGFLLALGVSPTGIPQATEARSGLFRSLLWERRMVILLDNARNAEQVRPLLPATGASLVLVTSRSQLSGLVARDGARRIVLDMLSPEESFALLRSIIGDARVDAEPEATTLLAERCGHLPLALRIASEVAAARPHAPLADLAAELTPGSGRLDALATYDEDDTAAVRDVFAWSYRNLSPGVARVFRHLSVHAGPDISLKAAAALLAMPLSLTLRNLLTLSGANLLETPEENRFRFHDLIRDYARERSLAEDEEADRRRSVRRLFRWYLFNAEEGSKVLNLRRGPAPFSIPADERPDAESRVALTSKAGALAWCEAEFPNLLSVVRQASEVGELETAWQLPIALRSFFQLWRPTSDWLDANHIALAAARTLGDEQAQIVVLRTVGSSYNYLGRIDEYFDYCTQATALSRRTGYMEGWCLNSLGDALVLLERFQEAVDCLRSALYLAHRDADSWLTAHSLENIAPALHTLGRHEEAIASLDEALAIFITLDYPFGQGLVTEKLADVYYALERFEDAMAAGLRAYTLHVTAGNKLGEISALGLLARMSESTSHLGEALGYRARAIALLEELGHPDVQVMRPELARLQGLAGQPPAE